MLTEFRDRAELREWLKARLRREGAWAAYALADLQPGLFEQSRWYVAEGGGLVLEYCGFTPHILMGFGTTEQLRPLVAGLPPGEYALSWPWTALPALAGYATTIVPMYRMALGQGVRLAMPEGVSPLAEADAAAVAALIAPSHGTDEDIDAFAASQMQDGAFFGAWQGGELVGVAGTHVVDAEERLAAVGNVYVRPDVRGQGLGGRLTAAVVAGLQQRGVEMIVLNVKQRNTTAQRVYTQLGFVIDCAFAEGVLTVGRAD